jgi:pimeloyl-ACP methyl ester carboxylesterase
MEPRDINQRKREQCFHIPSPYGIPRRHFFGGKQLQALWGARRYLAHVMLGMQQDLAALVPHARCTIARQSGHTIQQEQPALVSEAIRQVVTGVRDRDTWYDLVPSCRS